MSQFRQAPPAQRRSPGGSRRSRSLSRHNAGDASAELEQRRHANGADGLRRGELDTNSTPSSEGLQVTGPVLRPASPSQELICSGIGLTLKVSLALVAGVSLVRLAGAYQQRIDRYGEISAVLDIQQAKLLKAQNRFDHLFATGGEQRLIQEQEQWIAPNRLRVVWKLPTGQANVGANPFPTVEHP